MAIQAKRKSKGDRTSQARRATSNRPEQTAVTPAMLPESAAPDTSTAESKVAEFGTPQQLRPSGGGNKNAQDRR